MGGVVRVMAKTIGSREWTFASVDGVVAKEVVIKKRATTESGIFPLCTILKI